MCQYSEEGDTECLGIFGTDVRRFPEKGIIPHTGWNNISHNATCMFNDIQDESDVYFVHSYYCDISPETTAVCEYLVPFSAAMQKDNFYSTQFHPEKSGEAGMSILSNFLKSCY
jgi:glutamine amidotransferase